MSTLVKSAYEDIIQNVASIIFGDVGLSQPLFAPKISTESQAEDTSKSLPLIYIWNENSTVGSYSISLNTPIVSSILELFMARNHEDFNEIRDYLAETFRDISIESIRQTCEHVSLPPSVVFSADAYLAMVEQHGTDFPYVKEALTRPKSDPIDFSAIKLIQINPRKKASQEKEGSSLTQIILVIAGVILFKFAVLDTLLK